MRERGLKPTLRDGHRQARRVAPRAGAWIETIRYLPQTGHFLVAPRAGAWIETTLKVLGCRKSAPFPMRERREEEKGATKARFMMSILGTQNEDGTDNPAVVRGTGGRRHQGTFYDVRRWHTG